MWRLCFLAPILGAFCFVSASETGTLRGSRKKGRTMVKEHGFSSRLLLKGVFYVADSSAFRF